LAFCYSKTFVTPKKLLGYFNASFSLLFYFHFLFVLFILCFVVTFCLLAILKTKYAKKERKKERRALLFLMPDSKNNKYKSPDSMLGW
jgi:formate hydrogenlyase subunit 3/multisubunit Na+/H+ antiporter MnhD subunit